MEDSGPNEPLYSIGELAEKSGISRRTVRFYVQKGLVDAPLGRGRSSGYTQHHLEQIQRVRLFQREGLELDQIQNLPEEAAPTDRFAAQAVLRIPLGGGNLLEVEARRGPPSKETLEQIAELLKMENPNV
jgi:DNA-binding transcriptional MerR regulator